MCSYHCESLYCISKTDVFFFPTIFVSFQVTKKYKRTARITPFDGYRRQFSLLLFQLYTSVVKFVVFCSISYLVFLKLLIQIQSFYLHYNMKVLKCFSYAKYSGLAYGGLFPWSVDFCGHNKKGKGDALISRINSLCLVSCNMGYCSYRGFLLWCSEADLCLNDFWMGHKWRELRDMGDLMECDM